MRPPPVLTSTGVEGLSGEAPPPAASGWFMIIFMKTSGNHKNNRFIILKNLKRELCMPIAYKDSLL